MRKNQKKAMRKNTVFTYFNERQTMYKVFPHPKKVKTFKKDQYSEGQPSFPDDDQYEFAFRREFENCGRKITSDIFTYKKRKNKRKRNVTFITPFSLE